MIATRRATLGSMRFLVVALVAGGVASSCARPASPPLASPAAVPRDPLASATALLARERFERASRLLAGIAGSCDPEGGETRERATLLLATAELDLANPDGSPDRAAALALRLIEGAGTSSERAAVARALYRIALDRGAADPYAAPPVDSTAASPDSTLVPSTERSPGTSTERDRTEIASGETCARSDAGPRVAGPVTRLGPTPPPAPTTAARLAALHDSLTIKADSLRMLRGSLVEHATRVHELEAELERIRKLLKGPPR